MDDCIAVSSQRSNDNVELLADELQGHSATGTRTRVARVRAEYPSQLDYSGLGAAVRALFVQIQKLACFCQIFKRTAAQWLRPLKTVGCPRTGSKPTGVLQTFAPPVKGNNFAESLVLLLRKRQP